MRYLLLILSLLFIPFAAQAVDWPQDAGNSARSGYTAEEPTTPWTYRWSFNGPSDSANPHFYDVGHSDTSSNVWEGRTITIGNIVYVPALSNGLYALNLSTGAVLWNRRDADFRATPAYDPSTNSILVGSSNGNLYKFTNSNNSNVPTTYSAGSALNKSVLIVNGFAYVTTQSGFLHKVRISDMTAAWSSPYNAGAEIVTPPAYSQSRDLIIFADSGLNVHGVKADKSTQGSWKVKPSPRTPSFVYTFAGYWPVIAEQHGIVFLRMNIGYDGLWSGPGIGGKYPSTNSETRTFLDSHKDLKNLFALNLDTGAEAFIPAIGPGGVEAMNSTLNTYIMTGPVPVIKTWGTDEVAYSHFRNGQTTDPNYDGRWDSHLGEMYLENVGNYTAGDMRFLKVANNSATKVTDEQTPLTMAGTTLFHSHWGAVESYSIQNRSANLGNLKTNPILTNSNPTIIRRFQACGTQASNHYTTCGLTLFDDGRYWDGPGFWVYWNQLDPPTPHRSAYSEGILPRYTYVANGYIITQGNGGELFVLSHSGGSAPPPTLRPSDPPISPTLQPSNTPTPTPIPGDLNGDTHVTFADIMLFVKTFAGIFSYNNIVRNFGH